MKNHTWHIQKQRNKVRKLTRQAKKERERKIAQEVKSNPKKFWNYVAAWTKTRQEISELEIPNTTDGRANRQGQNRTKRKLMYYQTLSAEFTQRKIVEIYPSCKAEFYRNTRLCNYLRGKHQ